MVSALIHTARGSNDPDMQEKPSNSSRSRLQQPSIAKALQKSSGSKRKAKVPTTTLIVAPTSLLSQWASELKRSSVNGSLEVLVWHGTGRVDLEAEVDAGLDVCITSYGVLASEHSKISASKNKSQLHQSEHLIDTDTVRDN